jgi:hypothetical protein
LQEKRIIITINNNNEQPLYIIRIVLQIIPEIQVSSLMINQNCIYSNSFQLFGISPNMSLIDMDEQETRGASPICSAHKNIQQYFGFGRSKCR